MPLMLLSTSLTLDFFIQLLEPAMPLCCLGSLHKLCLLSGVFSLSLKQHQASSAWMSWQKHPSFRHNRYHKGHSQVHLVPQPSGKGGVSPWVTGYLCQFTHKHKQGPVATCPLACLESCCQVQGLKSCWPGRPLPRALRTAKVVQGAHTQENT